MGPRGTLDRWRGKQGGMPGLEIHYPYTQHTLSNGLQVLVNPDPSSPAVTVDLWYRVGSRDEDAGASGFAHLFEHLMFQGSTHVASGEHLATMQAAGGTANGTTSFDRTNYFETIPAHALDLALWMEADRMAGLAVTQDNLDNQREVVLEEKRQRYDNAPYGDLLQLMLALGFPESHPYAHPTIGSMPDLMAAPLERVRAFHDHWYQPANASLVLSGALDADDAISLVERHFGALPSPAPPDRAAIAALPPHPEIARETVTREVPRDFVAMAWRVPAMRDPAAVPVAQTAAVLGQGQASRLHRALVRRDELAEGVSMSVLDLAEGNSLALCTASVCPGVDPRRVEDGIVAEIAHLAETGPTPEEVQRASAQFEREWLTDLSCSDERADHFNEAVCLYGDADKVNALLGEVEAVTPEAIRSATATWLHPEHRAVLHYLASETR